MWSFPSDVFLRKILYVEIVPVHYYNFLLVYINSESWTDTSLMIRVNNCGLTQSEKKI
jgi:hypothetical protein